MEYESIRKNKRYVFFFILSLILAFFVWVILEINDNFQDRPSEIASQWICESPYIIIDVSEYSEANSRVSFCGETLDGFFDTLNDEFYMFCGWSNEWEAIMFSGDYRYSWDKKKLILRVDNDNLYGGKYRKLVFTPVPGTEVTTE